VTTPRRTSSQDELDPHDRASTPHESRPRDDDHPTDVFQAYWEGEPEDPSHAETPAHADPPTARLEDPEYPTQVIEAYQDEPDAGGRDRAEQSYAQQPHAGQSYDTESYAGESYAGQSYDTASYAGESYDTASYTGESYAGESYAQDHGELPRADRWDAGDHYADDRYAEEQVTGDPGEATGGDAHRAGVADGGGWGEAVGESGGQPPSVAAQLFGAYGQETDGSEDTAIIPRFTDGGPDRGSAEPAPAGGHDADEPLTLEHPAVTAEVVEPARAATPPSAPPSAPPAVPLPAPSAPLLAGHDQADPGDGEPGLFAGYSADPPATGRRGAPAPDRTPARGSALDRIAASGEVAPVPAGAGRPGPEPAAERAAPEAAGQSEGTPSPDQPAPSVADPEPGRRPTRRERRKAAREAGKGSPGDRGQDAATGAAGAAAGVAALAAGGAALAAGGASGAGRAAEGARADGARGPDAGTAATPDGRTELIPRLPDPAAPDGAVHDPAADPPAADGPAGSAAAQDGGRSRRPMLVGLVLLLVTLLGAAGAYLAWSHTPKAGEASAGSGADDAGGNLAFVDQASTSAVKNQVAAAINAIYSYDSAELDQSEGRALSFITGSYVDQFKKNFATVRQLAPKEKAALTSTVVETGVESLTQSRATLLVMVNQIGRRGDNPQPLRASVRLSVTAEKVDGQWKVADVVQK
jgi:Mce-associated membrane protein